ncbi:hypothetical protein TYM08_P2299 [Marinicellulosiphila megalodicopiae]
MTIGILSLRSVQLKNGIMALNLKMSVNFMSYQIFVLGCCFVVCASLLFFIRSLNKEAKRRVD